MHPEYRRQGLGQRLLAACIEKAWSKGLTRMELEARADNQGAIALYEKLGFEHAALKPQAMRFGGGVLQRCAGVPAAQGPRLKTLGGFRP